MSAQALARTCRFCLWAFWAFLTREHRWNGDTAKLNAQIETALCMVSQVIPPVPSLFTLVRPYLAQFSPVSPRFLRVFTISSRRFQRAPSPNPRPRKRDQNAKTKMRRECAQSRRR